VAVEAERDLAVALGQVRRELEHAVGAHPRQAHHTTVRSHGVQRALPTLSGCAAVPDHATSRAFPRLSGNGMTLPVAPPKALPKAPGEATTRRFRAASSSSSASSVAASCSCSRDSGTHRGSASRSPRRRMEIVARPVGRPVFLLRLSGPAEEPLRRWASSAWEPLTNTNAVLDDQM
jgi:hypothetical protein